jgi:hypothetical protein
MGVIVAILGPILTFLTFSKPILDWLNSAFDFRKNTGDLFAAANDPLQDTTSAADDHVIERAHAAADLLRAYSRFGFLEYLIWMSRAVIALLFISRWFASIERLLPSKRQ